MKPLTIHRNWNYIDQLDGKDLEDGETVLIEWPDGTRTTEVIVLEKEDVPSTDHGAPIVIPTHRAGVHIMNRGMRTWLRIPPGTLMERVGQAQEEE